MGTDARTKANVLLLRLPAQSYGSWLFEQSWPARSSLTACCYFMFTAQPTFRILMARVAPRSALRSEIYGSHSFTSDAFRSIYCILYYIDVASNGLNPQSVVRSLS